jgi:hypothetical protein
MITPNQMLVIIYSVLTVLSTILIIDVVNIMSKLHRLRPTLQSGPSNCVSYYMATTRLLVMTLVTAFLYFGGELFWTLAIRVSPDDIPSEMFWAMLEGLFLILLDQFCLLNYKMLRLLSAVHAGARNEPPPIPPIAPPTSISHL